MNKAIQLLVPTACAAAIAAPAFAQLEEIVVTATRRVESLQDVPISVTAMTGEAILDGGFSDMEDVSEFIPNLFMRDTFVGQRLSIRGIGTSPSNEAFEQAVAQFNDGVYYGRDNLGQNAFFDLERIEVVRGPQPTFAGQSATAGALNVLSRRPGDQFEGNLSLAYGDDAETNFEFGVGGPVGDNFGIRFSGRYYELDDTGYYNVVTGDDLGVKENSAARVIGVWSPSDDFELTFKYEHQDVWQLGTPYRFSDCDLDPATSLGNPGLSPGMPAMCAMDVLNPLAPNRTTLDTYEPGAAGGGGIYDIWDVVEALDADQGLTPGAKTTGGVSWSPTECAQNPIAGCSPVSRGMNTVREFGEDETREFQADIFAVSFDWDIGDNLTLSSITSFVEYDKQDWLDPDRSTMAIFSDLRIETFEQSSQELRLSSSADQTFEWMAGVYWQEHDLDTLIDIYLPFVLGAPTWVQPGSIGIGYGSQLLETSTWNSAFFAGTWNLSDTFRINIGARYQEVKKSGILTPTVASLLPGASEYTAFTPFPATGPQPIPGLNADGDDTLPELGVQWDASDNVMLYAKYAEAFKAGGFIMAPAPAGMFPDPPDFRAEFAEGYELGLKGRFLDDQLEFNVAYYDTDYTDLQVTVFDPQTSSFLTTNAGQAVVDGFEFDGRWAVSDSFTLGFNGSVGDATYEVYVGANECNSLVAKQWQLDGNGPASTCVVDLSGEPMPYHSEWSLGLMPQLDFNLGSNLTASLSANIFFSDGFYSGDDRHPITWIDSYERVDLRFAIMPTDGNWQIAVYGRDLTDEKLPFGRGENNFQSRTLALAYDGSGGEASRGARYGVQLNYFFGN